MVKWWNKYSTIMQRYTQVPIVKWWNTSLEIPYSQMEKWRNCFTRLCQTSLSWITPKMGTNHSSLINKLLYPLYIYVSALDISLHHEPLKCPLMTYPYPLVFVCEFLLSLPSATTNTGVSPSLWQPLHSRHCLLFLYWNYIILYMWYCNIYKILTSCQVFLYYCNKHTSHMDILILSHCDNIIYYGIYVRGWYMFVIV